MVSMDNSKLIEEITSEMHDIMLLDGVEDHYGMPLDENGFIDYEKMRREK